MSRTALVENSSWIWQSMCYELSEAVVTAAKKCYSSATVASASSQQSLLFNEIWHMSLWQWLNGPCWITPAVVWNEALWEGVSSFQGEYWQTPGISTGPLLATRYLVSVINQSSTHGTFPQPVKEMVICPLLKKKSQKKNDTAHYPPNLQSALPRQSGWESSSRPTAGLLG